MSSDPAAHATSLHGRRKPSTWKRLMLLSPFWSLFFWAALWELIGQMGWNDLIPPLSATWFAILDLFDSAQFWDALWLTSRTFLIGLGLAIVIGIPSAS
jgi:ABC-type nitrate/sulfonate/bicarbonate transport system permease component